VQTQADRAGKVAQRRAPIVLPGATVEVAASIVDVGVKLEEPADATDADGQKKIPQSAAQPKCPPEAGDEMSALGRLEQNVTFVELNHKAEAPLKVGSFFS
jgi:hypothetical protein